MVMLVDLCQVAQLGLAETALGSEEAALHAEVGELSQAPGQHLLVVRPDLPDQDGSAAGEPFHHATICPSARAGVCAAGRRSAVAERALVVQLRAEAEHV